VSALEPGIYRATFASGDTRIIKVVDPDVAGNGCTVYAPYGRCVCHGLDGITDARPLVVLDLDENDARHLVSYLEITVEEHPDQLGSVGRAVYTNVAAQIEAQTKPARIPEPGLWGVVEAKNSPEYDRSNWVHDEYGWTHHSGLTLEWRFLTDPTLIREGLS